MNLMKPSVRFDWDDANTGHVARHAVRPFEAEQVLRGAALSLGSEEFDEEVRHTEIGETASERLLVVVWTWRGKSVRVVTAFPPNRRLQAFWKRQKKEIR